MTDYKFGDKTVLHVRMPENEQWAQQVLEETYRNYTGNSRLVGNLDQINSDPSVNGGPPAVVEAIIDASGSMNGEMNGECKMDVAKLLLLNTINRMIAHPVGARTSFMLRVLGHTPHSKPDCQETELLVAPGRLRDITQYKLLVDQILGLTAGSKTPITYALLQAGKDLFRDFRHLPGTRHVMLVSDGAETQCMNNPGYAADLLRKDNATVDVVSIGLQGDIKGREQLAQIATAGRFRNTEQLSENTKGAPYVGANAMGEYKSGKYVFPSPAEAYGHLNASTRLEGKVMFPKSPAKPNTPYAIPRDSNETRPFTPYDNFAN
jgi:hypothetical protein